MGTALPMTIRTIRLPPVNHSSGSCDGGGVSLYTLYHSPRHENWRLAPNSAYADTDDSPIIQRG